MGSKQTLEVQVEEVYNFFGASFELTFDPTQIVVVEVKSGPAFGHADMPGAPQVQIGSGIIRFANTRFSDPILLADRLTLATITFESVIPAPNGGVFGGWVDVADQAGTISTIAFTAAAWQVVAASGIRGQALWPDPAVTHDLIPVQVTTSAGIVIGQEPTDTNGFYPAVNPFPAMPANGQIRINPLTLGMPQWGCGRIPALETRLTNCPAATNLTAHTVRLVGGDVAPLNPGMTGNNVIDIGDLALAASRFGQAIDVNNDCWIDGDVNDDWVVDITDIVIIANNFGKRGPICEFCP
jgi:hypothetical protein